MIEKIKQHLLMSVSLLTIAMSTLAPVAIVRAGCSTIDDKLAQGAKAASGNKGDLSCSGGLGGNAEGSIGKIASNIVNLFSVVVGAVAVIMIIYGGFRYITSGGSSERVGAAKNTLIYAIIGLIIVVLAQFIVHF